MLVTKQLPVAIDFYSLEKNTMEVNGYQQLFGNYPFKLWQSYSYFKNNCRTHSMQLF